MKNNRLTIGLILVLFLIMGSWRITHSKVPLRAFPEKGDNWGYYQQARQVLSGDFTAVHSKPGLVYFEALLIKIFDAHNKNPDAEENRIYAILKFANVILGSLAAVLVYLIALFVFKRKPIALITMLILAIYCFPLAEAKRLLTEPLYTFFATLSIFLILRTFRYFLLRDKILAGLSLGLALITRGEIKSFIPLIFIWALVTNIDIPSWKKGRRNIDTKKWRRISSSYLLILCFIILPILPLTLRNYRVTKEFIPINTDSGGEALWIGNLFSRATRNFTGHCGKALLDSIERDPRLKQQYTNVMKYQGYASKEGSDLYFKYALENIKSDPRDFFLRCLVKLRIMWSVGHIWDILLIVPAIFIGMFMALFLISNKESWLLLLYIWNNVLIHVISRARGGHDQIPFISLAIIFAAFAIYVLAKGFWKGLKDIIQKKGLTFFQIDRDKRKCLISIFLLVIALGAFSCKFRNEVSIVLDRKPPYAFVSLQKTDSNLVSISGLTEPDTLVVLEDNGKERKEKITVKKDGSFCKLVRFSPGEHKLILEFYDKAYNCREMEKTITIR